MRWIDGLDECELVGSVDPTNLTSPIESRLINVPRSLERINEAAVDLWSELHCFDDDDRGKIESEIGNNNNKKKRRIVWARISRLAISISWQLLRCSLSLTLACRTYLLRVKRERERERERESTVNSSLSMVVVGVGGGCGPQLTTECNGAVVIPRTSCTALPCLLLEAADS